jgi:hypothetical protein
LLNNLIIRYNTSDGMHRIIATKELGYDTILMWKKI